MGVVKKAFLCVALSFLCIVPVWSADEPDYSSLPFGMEYLGPAINVYPAEAAKDYIEVLYHDGIQAAFRYGNGPERFFDDVESIPTIEILYTIACQEDFTGHRYVLPETCERDMEFLFWKYPELQIAFDQPDFSRELLHLYKICSCKEYQVPLGSNIISNALAPVIARNQTLKEIEYLLIYNQLVHGEYSFFEKQAMVSAFEQAGGTWIPFRLTFRRVCWAARMHPCTVGHIPHIWPMCGRPGGSPAGLSSP